MGTHYEQLSAEERATMMLMAQEGTHDDFREEGGDLGKGVHGVAASLPTSGGGCPTRTVYRFASAN